jgi:lysophospholipase L1-like esterase
MGKRRGHEHARTWGIGGVAAVGALVLGLAGFALAQTRDAPANAGSVPQLPAASALADSTNSLRAVFVGDSYTAGAGATDSSVSFARLATDRMGWDLVNLGRGGTSYLATSDAAGCGLAYCPNYVEMIPTVAAADPDVVVISGGRNDTMGPEVAAQIERLYTELRAAVPDAQILALSPLADDDAAPPGFARMGATIKASVEETGGSYLDLGQPLAGRPELISDDGIHPNDKGHAAIADTLVPLLPAQ